MSSRVDPFEEFANDYDATVQRAIGAAGESVQYFGDIKASLVRESLGNTSPALVLDFGCGVGNTTRGRHALCRRIEPGSRVPGKAGGGFRWLFSADAASI
jgi:hypothetical protein